MKTWENRFFGRNKESEVEFKGVYLSYLFRGLDALGWNLDDEFLAPDLQVSRFLRGEDELFVMHETYFDPKLTGNDKDIEALREHITKIDPNEVLYAGARPEESKIQAEHLLSPD